MHGISQKNTISMNKKIFLKLADFLSIIWRILPFKLRKFLFTGLFVLESRDKKTSNGLKRIFYVKDNLELVINERAINYGKGIHPKHRLTNYHQFFIDRINDGEVVLDIGCGNGAVAIDIALSKPNSSIIGIDINKESIDFAEKLKVKNALKNISFIFGDITSHKVIKSNVVILSNILEHIEERQYFLKKIIENTGAETFLIRVPHFERDWQMPLRKELNIYYYSDLDHKIEHTLKEFEQEINNVNLNIKEILTFWGEIWAKCEYDK